MNWFWMNIPAALVFVGLWSGIPMWLVLKHPDEARGSVAVQAPARITRYACRAADRAGPAAQRAAGGRVTATGEAK